MAACGLWCGARPCSLEALTDCSSPTEEGQAAELIAAQCPGAPVVRSHWKGNGRPGRTRSFVKIQEVVHNSLHVLHRAACEAR